jgi:hypothetical protein
MIEAIIRSVRPDYVQIDCKGRRGLSSYPTKVGNPAPGFVEDQLKLWRQVTRENGVALFVHYCGVGDEESVARHPDWARVDHELRRSSSDNSVFGLYADSLLIPQLRELAEVYDVDGAWIDADCYEAEADFRADVIASFHQSVPGRKENTIPAVNDQAFASFCRDGYRRYLRHYTSALHETHPRFQLATNWAFSHFMPEPITAQVNWLSGDYSAADSVNSARFAARYLSSQKAPWDLMAWSFVPITAGPDLGTKSAVQLQREAAIVISQGGGFQAYFHQRRDASLELAPMNIMAQVAEFVRARQKICHRTETVREIGLLHSSSHYYRRTPHLFAPGDETEPAIGTLELLLNRQWCVDVVSEHHLDDVANWPMILIPESQDLDDKFRRTLLKYVRSGGRLVVIGARSALQFQNEAAVRLLQPPRDSNSFVDYDSQMTGISGEVTAVEPLTGTTARGRILPQPDRDLSGAPAATIALLGSGRLAAIWIDIGRSYRKGRPIGLANFVDSLLRECAKPRLVEVTGSHLVDVVVRRAHGALIVNLTNTAGPHSDVGRPLFDEIPAIGSIKLRIRLPERPKQITCQPGSVRLPFSYANGEVSCETPVLRIHCAVVVDV